MSADAKHKDQSPMPADLMAIYKDTIPEGWRHISHRYSATLRHYQWMRNIVRDFIGFQVCICRETTGFAVFTSRPWITEGEHKSPAQPTA